MKIIIITTVYKSYWNAFYFRHIDLHRNSYADQKQILYYDAFGWADFWSYALRPLGYEVMEVIANIPSLQKAWAQENNVAFNSDWVLKIPFEQVRKFQPTVLFMDDYATFSESWLKELKAACPSIRLVIGWCGAPFQNEKVFGEYDLVLSCIPELVEQFRAMGHWSEHLNHAFEPRILERIDLTIKPDIDFSFIGQINRNNQYHLQRDQILEQISYSLPIQIFSPTAMLTWEDEAKTILKRSLYGILRSLKNMGIPEHRLTQIPKVGKFATLTNRPLSSVNPRLKPFIKPAVFGLEMYQTLRRSQLTFNSHIALSAHSASNMRMFEATGVGTCLITDWKENIKTLFEPDQEVVTYQSAAECIEKIRWLLDHPQERQAIAQAGQNRTLKHHIFADRAEKLDALITRALKIL